MTPNIILTSPIFSGPLLTPPSSPRRRRRTSSPLNSPAHASTGYYATLVGTSSSHLHSRSGSSTSLASSRPHSSPSSPGHHAAGTPASNQGATIIIDSSSILFYPFHLNTSYQTDMWYETHLTNNSSKVLEEADRST